MFQAYGTKNGAEEKINSPQDTEEAAVKVAESCIGYYDTLRVSDLEKKKTVWRNNDARSAPRKEVPSAHLSNGS